MKDKTNHDPKQGTRFLVDVMLGKLARWLRVLGWDTEYRKDKSIDELLDRAAREGRVLLTRKQLEHERLVYIKSEILEEQLKQLERQFGVITDARPFTRCIECNRMLERTDKKTVRGRVPFYTYSTQESFYTCPGCGKVYWPGSHHQAMLKKVEELKTLK
ncbi:hypothetical protein GF359_08385 [candidate division WOR-3 bacterium]|uniref:Mut7-C RNAse domain-containing protein n=1 Tax=candidate division WOR-3 bacterium TaxID=2052148 RepID=A0A9D5QDL6_UNCW3|nr:hypothetical protein [candidate division WOR-3 bacterium]MBD3365217.1 hypothetical protein [candidate division WOR-3 bacterium]